MLKKSKFIFGSENDSFWRASVQNFLIKAFAVTIKFMVYYVTYGHQWLLSILQQAPDSDLQTEFAQENLTREEV